MPDLTSPLPPTRATGDTPTGGVAADVNALTAALVKVQGAGLIAASDLPGSATVTTAETITPPAGTVALYAVTALASAATVAAPTGTPTDGQRLMLRIRDDGTTRALTWGPVYRPVGTTLPSTTAAGKTLYVGCFFNAAAALWDVIAVGQEA